MRVVLAAARRAFLDERIGMIETAELVPHAVDVEALALANAYEFATQVNTDLPGRGRAVGIVEFGASKTTVVVLDDLVCVFAREFYRGGDDLTEAIARKLGVDAAQAEALKREPAERTHEIAGALEDVLEEICQDVKISLDFFENQNDRQADVVLLTGGSCGVAGMRDAMERMLGRPVDVWNPLDGIPVQMNAESEATMRAHAWQCGVALGLALRFDP
jgi:type IV pilus assembly protein PilM